MNEFPVTEIASAIVGVLLGWKIHQNTQHVDSTKTVTNGKPTTKLVTVDDPITPPIEIPTKPFTLPDPSGIEDLLLGYTCEEGEDGSLTKVKLDDFQEECVRVVIQTNKGLIILPTGTGKTHIIAHVIIEILKQEPTASIVVFSPKIFLVNQMYIRLRKDLRAADIHPKFSIVHSRLMTLEEMVWLKKSLKITDKVVDNFELPQPTTHADVILVSNVTAKKQGKAHIICSTYDSWEVVKNAKLDIDARIFDEVHHTAVDPDNGKDNHSQAVTKLESRRTYGFTATHKEIEGVDVGPVIYRKTEREMIKKSRMLPPQLHEVVAGETEPGDNADCKVMEDTFREYRRLTNTGVKLLVSCRKAVHGTSHIIPLLKHANRMRRTRPHLKVFAVHSSFGCVIGDNGPELRNVSDLEFQYELLNHCQDDRNEAIILHYDILSEGYDIPTLTGTLFYSAACDRRIKQITGRSLRLHTEDRKRLGLDEDHEEVLQAANYDDFIKPFGIVSYAYYGSNGDDTRDRITEVIHDMRTLDEIKRTIIQTTPYNMEELKKVQNVRREKGEPIPLYDLDEYYGNIEHRFEEQQRIQEELNRKEQQIIKSNQLINELFETDVDALFS